MQDCVIDISHWSGLNLDFKKAKAAGIQGIFHKCTQGTRYVDPRFVINRQSILDAGLLFGAFHFGTGTDTAKNQADYFLETAKQGDLLALDFEPNPKGPTMTIGQAVEFCLEVERATGRPLIIYTGAPMLPAAVKLNANTRPLWFAQYAPTPSRAPSGWPLSLWQYSDHAFVDGIGHCDRNEFYGDDLEAFWKG